MQKMLVAANKFPDQAAFKQFASGSEQIKDNSIECKRTLKRHMKEIQAVQEEMFRISETKIKLSALKTDSASLKEIWNTLDSNFTKTLPFIEDTIEKWNSRTKLISNLA